MMSRYLRTRQRGNVVAIFHQLHPNPVFCSTQDYNQLLADPNSETDLVEQLKERRLVVTHEDDDREELRRITQNLEGKLNQTTILYLMTARGCNFNCGYCPVPELARQQGEAFLSIADAKAGIDLWAKHLAKSHDPNLEYFVIFYGGEPTLNKEVIYASVGYLRQLSETVVLPPINLMIATNGSLFDNRLINLCQENKIMVAVGLDGPQDQNDKYRVDLNGQGTHETAVSTIKQLVRAGVRTFASVSITPHNLDKIPRYSAFFHELGVEKFGFNFLKGKYLLQLVGHDGLLPYYEQASNGIIENYRLSQQPNFEYQMEKKLAALRKGDFFPVDCTCYGNQLVIQADGQISNCPFYRACLGRVGEVEDDFLIWKQPIVQEWRKRLPLLHPDFANEDSMAICGAGCAWSTAQIKGDWLAVDDASLIFSRRVFDEFILPEHK